MLTRWTPNDKNTMGCLLIRRGQRDRIPVHGDGAHPDYERSTSVAGGFDPYSAGIQF